MSASQTRAAGPRLPSLAELNRATKATAAAIADPDATVHDIHQAAELEAATVHAFWRRGRSAQAELEREPEAGT